MPKKAVAAIEPDNEDVAKVIKDAREDFELILKFEWLFEGSRSTCVCRAFFPGRVRRSDVAWQAKHTSPDSAARKPAYMAYHAALDVYMQADRARARSSFDATVGLAPVVSVPL